MSGPSDYREELYTTKLDRSGKDFKAREREAQKLADEIMNVSAPPSACRLRYPGLTPPRWLQTATSNPHIAEERGQKVEDEMDEESK